MLLNVSTYIGRWPFRPLPTETLDGVCALAEKEGSSHIITANLNGLFYTECNLANEELYAQLQSYKGNVKVLPFAMIDPTYVCWEKDLNTCLETYGFKGVEIAPSYHHYKWNSRQLFDFYKMCEEKNIPVRINNSFENHRQRNFNDQQGEFNKEIRDLIHLPFKPLTILTQINPFSIADLGLVFADHKDLYIDISRMGNLCHGVFYDALNGYPIDRFCYGSLLPFQYADSALARVYFAEITDEEKEGILFGSLAKKLGL